METLLKTLKDVLSDILTSLYAIASPLPGGIRSHHNQFNHGLPTW